METLSKYAKLAVALVVVALIAYAFVWTYERGYGEATAAGDKALSNYKAQQQADAAKAASDAFGKYADNVLRGQNAESAFLKSQAGSASETKALKEQIDVVTKPQIVVRTVESPAPAEPCLFTRGFVRLWNAAAGIADDDHSALQASAGPGSPTYGAGTDAATCSGVSPADILDWFVDYANRTRTLEDKLRGVAAALPTQP
ncbi:hypothetical protein WL94_20240 [Burkholderia cepacia]|uniref:hypothetical protein n=1 Tax=Burkholderia cepacia TaxID=292 RepID=UPI00075765BD|nr:hypothetical protein [Burkholderia cepacia]KWF84998.1 hypothetical protein WL94_20240 [Burkholderia cepacia]